MEGWAGLHCSINVQQSVNYFICMNVYVPFALLSNLWPRMNNYAAPKWLNQTPELHLNAFLENQPSVLWAIALNQTILGTKLALLNPSSIFCQACAIVSTSETSLEDSAFSGSYAVCFKFLTTPSSFNVKVPWVFGSTEEIARLITWAISESRTR